MTSVLRLGSLAALMMALAACGGGGGGSSNTGNEGPAGGGNGGTETTTLQIGVTGSGAVSSQPSGIACGNDCSESFTVGTEVTLSANPAAGYQFSGWSGSGVSCSDGSTSCTIELAAASTVTATFTPVAADTVALNLQRSGTGTVLSSPSGINCGSDCSESYAKDTQVTLTAAAGSGYTFAGWDGVCTGTNATCTVTLSQARTISAIFVAAPAVSACNGFYAADFTPVSGTATQSILSSSRPVKGRAFADPTYRTCIVRVTDHAAEAPSGFARNDYSRRQAFNADASKLLVYALDGHWHLYDANSYAHVRQLNGPAADAEPQWHPTDPNLLYYLPTNGGMVVNELNVSTNTSRVVGNFAGRLPWSNVARLWTKSEGSPSADARYWAFMAETSSFAPLGIVVWDRVTDTIVSTLNNSDRPDHLSMSASGNYVVVSWLNRVVAYDRNLRNPRTIQGSSEHSDIALDGNGDDLYVSVDYQSNEGMVFMINLRTGTRTDLFPTYLAGTATAMHFSGKAFKKPGWVLVSTYANYGGALQWLHRKIFAVQLAANPKIYQLAHTHVVDNGYWTEPQASVSRDFTKILFTSNWEVNTGNDLDAYMIELPKDALK
ncbi:InlB B-repeat-containing protein [Schlegelella sp. S2-27]|uniref:InlB B-repeat-containing protein n=1 Tax=Caldimonas mangrovi TaxID=2944811 RepID=A0ABT0YNP1_9BURK|nr:InlB B-repeat-containing protein [Caldimonas mangrovi]MCM5680337.1 InlB B-repeat-containing protein [Caldimonas mangrovi]